MPQRPAGFPSGPPNAARAAPGTTPAPGSTDLSVPASTVAAPNPLATPPGPPVDEARPPAPPPVPRVSTDATSPAIRTQAKREAPEPISHRGFVLEALVGTMGCTRSMCASSEGHDAKPNIAVSGFLGGNIGGFVDLGLEGGWGRLRADVPAGSNGLSLYGIDTSQLQQAVAQRLGITDAVMNFSAMTVDEAQMGVSRGGVALRVHFVPRGRVTAFAGSGVDYLLLRTRYDSARGPSRIDLHGLAVPISAGLGVYLFRHVALLARFDYLWSRYLLLRIDDPQTQFVAPVTMIADVGTSDLQRNLPHFWTVGAGLRANF